MREMKTSRGDVALRQGKQKEAPWTSSCSFRRTAGEELGRLDAEVPWIKRMELEDGRIQEAGIVGVGQRRSFSLVGLSEARRRIWWWLAGSIGWRRRWMVRWWLDWIGQDPEEGGALS